MDCYLLICTAISFIVLGGIKYGKGTNKANYYLSLLAIVSWFIPYPYIAEFVPKEILTEPVVISFSQLSSATVTNNEQHFIVDSQLWLNWIFWSLLSVGLLFLANRIMKFVAWNNQLKNDSSLVLISDLSSKHQLPIYMADDISNGMLVGIINPKIIISKLITNPKYIKLIIAHEKQHFKNNDNFRLLLLTIIESLFWWNPLCRKLIDINRFYIETLCDEHASNSYGRSDYINDLASLMLSSPMNQQHHFACSAISNSNNNISRIKLLKDQKAMTFRNKLIYTFIACFTVSVMSWNTLATATSNELNKEMQSEQKTLGALIDLNAIVTNKLKGEEENRYHNQFSVWVEFDKKATLTLGDDFTMTIKVHDEGESISLKYELIELIDSNNEIIAKPELTARYGDIATIQIDNPQISEYSYLIQATTLKVKNPRLLMN